MQIRPYEERDEQSLIRLLRSSFGGWFSRELSHHKYQGNPFGSIPPIISEEEGEVLGHFGLIQLPFDVEGKSRTGILPADVAVDPKLRKHSLGQRGVLREMWNLAGSLGAETADFGFAIPVPGFYAVGRKLFKARHLCTIPELTGSLSLRPGLHRRGVDGRSADLIAAALSPVQRSRFRPAVKSGRVFEVESRGKMSGFDRFWERTTAGRPVSLRKDPVYLDWRYLRHPVREYTLLGCEKNEEITGFIVFRCFQEGRYMLADILDFECIDGDSGSAGALFSGFLRYTRTAGSDIVRTWCCANHPLRQFLEKAGLQESDVSVKTLFIPGSKNDSADDLLANGDNWCFTMGDSDGR